jgi:hypothetical protein
MVRVNDWDSRVRAGQQPVHWVLGLATVPLLIVLLTSRNTAQLLRQLGEQSEELLHGERLPLLPFPIVSGSGVPPSKTEDFSIE